MYIFNVDNVRIFFQHRLFKKRYIIYSILLSFVFLAPINGAFSVEDVSVDRYLLDIMEFDQLWIFINPVLDYVSIDCKPIDHGDVSYAVRMNYTDQFFGETTAFVIQPESRGKYNITINFQGNFKWDYRIGVSAQNFDFYLEFYGQNIQTEGSFAMLYGPYTRLSGNWTINILLNSRSRSQTVFTFVLPSPANLILLFSSAGFIIYINAFLILNTYFKSKKEIVSNKRWLVIVIIVLISAFVIYQLYTFTTFFTSPLVV
jgi:hypothetical protein